jgi:cytidylate kinase
LASHREEDNHDSHHFFQASGQPGSYIATQVATALGWRYYDRELLHQAAAALGLTGEANLERLSKMEEQRGLVRSFLDILGVQPAIPTVPSASLRELAAVGDEAEILRKREGLSLADARQRVLSDHYTLPIGEVSYRDLLTQIVTELAQAGNAVIMGRGSQVILRTFPSALHIQIVAPYLTRIERLMEREVLDRASAKQRVAHADEMRAGFMRRYFNVDWLDPTLYDCVFNNSGHISEQFITDSIVAMARRL